MSSSDRPLVWGLLALVALAVVGLVVGSQLGLPTDVSAAVIALAGTAMGAVTTWLTRRTTTTETPTLLPEAKLGTIVAAPDDPVLPASAGATTPTPAQLPWVPPTKANPSPASTRQTGGPDLARHLAGLARTTDQRVTE